MRQMQSGRRTVFKKIMAGCAAFFGIQSVGAAKTDLAEKAVNSVAYDQDVPLFSGSVVHGDLVFIAGKGAHFEGDIASHTDHVLNELEKELVKAGSSMDKVLKVNVYLHDLVAAVAAVAVAAVVP